MRFVLRVVLRAMHSDSLRPPRQMPSSAPELQEKQSAAGCDGGACDGQDDRRHIRSHAPTLRCPTRISWLPAAVPARRAGGPVIQVGELGGDAWLQAHWE